MTERSSSISVNAEKLPPSVNDEPTTPLVNSEPILEGLSWMIFSDVSTL